MPGSNLSDVELQQLLTLMDTFRSSGEFEDVAADDEVEAWGNARQLVNFARVSRPGFDPSEEPEYDEFHPDE